MIKRVSRYAIPIFAASVLALAAVCAGLIHHQQKTLWTLLHPGNVPVSTDVYAAWTRFVPQERIALNTALATLHESDYQLAPAPSQAGLYALDGQTLTVFTRNFQYPDQAYPAKIIRLIWQGDHLDRLESADGSPLAEWRLEPRRLARWVSPDVDQHPQVRLDELPPYVPNAILAVEDKRFYHHGAFDGIGIARAVWIDLRQGRLLQGASTISQQLARSIFLDVNRTWRRKILEAALAFYLEIRYSKPQLLEMYLNQAYWGKDGANNLLGIESASRSYFGKPAHALDPSEGAMLAGLLESPNRLSPRHAPQAAIDRRNVVLRLMRDQGVLNADQYRLAVAEPLRLKPMADVQDDASYFLSTLQDELAQRYSLPTLLTQGWRIFTTLDPVLQAQAVRAFSGLAPSKKNPHRPQAALIALDPETGAVRAWVGGTDYVSSPFDRAFYAKRQPGSAFKPFVVATALESRRVTGITVLDDSPLTLRIDDKRWSPHNYDRRYHGHVSIADSLIQSWNVPIVRLAMQTGVPAIADAARRAGIASPLRPVPSLALGTSEVSVLELTDAYATLADGGTEHDPYSIDTLLSSDGQVIEAHAAQSSPAFSPEVTSLVTLMLQRVFDEGTAKPARAIGFTWPAAGKTGTSENDQDAWFLGYSSGIVCGVWVGYDKPESLKHTAAGVALPIWVRFMKPVMQMRNLPPPDVSTNLVWKNIDPASGLLVRSGCPQNVRVPFLAGTEPSQYCPLHPGGLLGFFKRLRKH